MNMSLSIFDQLCQLVDDPRTGWSLGTFGALAEFNRREREKVSIVRHDNAVEITTPRGALRIHAHPAIRPVAYETLSSLENAWSQGIVLCLPVADSAMAGNTVITEVGQDREALYAHANERLLDLGLGVSHVDFCIRTGDPALLHILEKHIGNPLLGDDSEAITAIRKASPVRVFRSRLGRIEVCQDIPPDTSDMPDAPRTPDGPHTHLMARLLAHGRTHAANIPVPDGWLPCLAAYPPNPIRTENGSLRSFDPEAFRRFQNLILAFSPPELAEIKKRVFDAVKNGMSPNTVPAPATRGERTAVRVALRQSYHLYGPSDVLENWKAVYESKGRQ